MSSMLALVRDLPVEKRLEFWDWFRSVVPEKVATLKAATTTAVPIHQVAQPVHVRAASPVVVQRPALSSELADLATFLGQAEPADAFRDTTLGRFLWDSVIAPSLQFGQRQDKRLRSILLDELFQVDRTALTNQVSTFRIPPMAPKGMTPRLEHLIGGSKLRCGLCGVTHMCALRLHLGSTALICGRTCGMRLLHLASLLSVIVYLRQSYSAMQPDEQVLRPMHRELMAACNKIQNKELDRAMRINHRYKNTPFEGAAVEEAYAIKGGTCIAHESADDGTDSEAGVSEAEHARLAAFIVADDDVLDEDSEWVSQ